MPINGIRTKLVRSEGSMVIMAEETRQEYLTVTEAARLADVPEHRIRNWLQVGYLKRYKVRRNVFVRRDELLEFLHPTPKSVEE